jgi:hypothetical protein
MEATPVQLSLKAPFPKLLAEFLGPILPDRVAYGIIRAAGDENISVQDLGSLLNSDPGYRHYLFAQTFLSEKMTEWTSETEKVSNRDEIVLGRILGLMGKISIRNLIACAATSRIAGEPVLREGDEKISTTPSRTIPFALAAEKICGDQNWIFPEAAFLAGLHYDWLQAIIKKGNGPPDEKAALENAFKEGLKLGQNAYRLGLKMKEIKLAKYLFSSGLILPIGKVLMACLFPKSEGDQSWSKFVSDCDQAGDKKADFYHYLESKRFPVTHLEMSSLLMNFGELLRGIEKAIYFTREPERLLKVDVGLHQLASILSILTAFEQGGEKALSEPRFEVWMKTNKITVETIKTLVK